MKNKIEVQGHRGARGLWPENSMIGFVNAIDLGVDVLEMDVVMTGDGKILVSHDPFFSSEFCLNPKGENIIDESEYNIFQMSYSEIDEFDCGSMLHSRFPNQTKIRVSKPLLKEVLANALKKDPAIRFNIEIKSQENWLGIYQPESIPEYVDAVVKDLGSLSKEQFNLQSFDRSILYYLAKKYPEIQLAYLIEGQALNIRSAKELGIPLYAISPDHTLLTKELVKLYQEQGLKVIPWTVNEPSDMRKLIKWEVDGLISDYPDKLMKILNEN